MDASRVFTILCAFLLIIALALSLTTVIILSRTMEESRAQDSYTVLPDEQSESTSLECFEDCTETPKETEKEDAPSMDADVLYQRLCMREAGGRIGIYSEDGYLIRMLDVQVSTLPKREREALSKGIYVNSWEELISLIRDYE